MCTLIAFHRVWEDRPLVVATNRDEAYDRPSSPPRWENGSLAPRDERSGGTWMGASERGVWVGITNRHAGEVDPARRSRGLLCLDLLSEPDAGAVAGRLRALGEAYNPFHLVAMDGREAWLVEHADGRIRARALGEGVHVVTNRPFDEAADEPKVARARALLAETGLPGGRAAAAAVRAPADLVPRFAAILADHGREGPDALCLHGGRYGTRSAAIWSIRPPAGGPAGVELAFANGPPCSAPFRPVDPAG